MLIPVGDDNERKRTPYFNYLLIGVNLAVFALFFFRPEVDYEEIVYDHGLIPQTWNLLDGLTSMFLHAGILHVLGNMLFLWIVGDNVEDKFGHIPYLFFYLAAGGAAAAAQVMMSTGDMMTVPMIGASGAVSGALGAYLVLFPKAKIKMILWIYIIIIPFRVSAWAVILIWAGLQALQAWQETQGSLSNVAVWAHLGGFAFGAAVGILWWLLKPFRSKESE